MINHHIQPTVIHGFMRAQWSATSAHCEAWCKNVVKLKKKKKKKVMLKHRACHFLYVSQCWRQTRTHEPAFDSWLEAIWFIVEKYKHLSFRKTLTHQLVSYGLPSCWLCVVSELWGSRQLALYGITKVDYFSKNLCLCSTEESHIHL